VIELTSREWASLAWMALALAGGVVWRPARESMLTLAGALLRPALLVPLGLLVAYTAALVAAASRTPAWDPTLLKATLVWLVAFGFVRMVGASRAPEEDRWFLRQAAETVRPVVLVEFYANLHTLPFWGEFALQGWVLALVLGEGARRWDAQRQGRPAAPSTVFGRLMGLTGAAVLGYVGLWLAGSWRTVDPAQAAREVLLPVWLTIGALPFIFVWAWFLQWDRAQGQIRRLAGGETVGIRTRLAVLVGYNANIRDLSRFAGHWARRVVEARTLRAKVAVVREHRGRMRAEEAGRRRRAGDLVRFASAPGVDWEGRRLDRREFAETVRALRDVGQAQMGWYRNPPEGRYKARVADFLPAFARGLPEDHGIRLRVRRDGQAWCAWRRTVTGWVFAVGAAGPPPDQRFYDGPEPPAGFPGPRGRWGRVAFEAGPNWGPEGPFDEPAAPR
jgi:hypothetical protein